ncbi:MAG TPA: 5-oxoprolinase subunit PxpA [Vicinamibacterales bacterium]
MELTVDLNADVGESIGVHHYGDDEGVMPFITSANIACGFHAGDPGVMRAAVALALAHGVSVGAHPGLPDLVGFGRREMQVSPRDVEDLVAYQVGALAGIAAGQGVRLAHVKPHGALYNMAARDRALADAVVQGIRTVDGTLAVFGLSNSKLIDAAAHAGLAAVSEAFADRGYTADGRLAPRGLPGAVVSSADDVMTRAVDMVRRKRVLALDGSVVALAVDTLCLHGDTPGAAELARLVRGALEAARIMVAPIRPSARPT